MKLLVLFAVALMMQVPQAALAAENEAPMGLEHAPVLAGTQYFRYDSDILGRSFHIHVKVPPDLPADARLPVIYLLDGDQTYPLMAAYSFYMTFAEEMNPAILVGISYGTTDPEVNMRNTDFTGPAASNPQYGGADRFLDVLETELIPEIESRFPADARRRVLVGQSLGGQFALHAALFRPGLFDLLIAVNPALHRNADFYTQALHQARHGPHSQFLFVSSAEFDDPRFREPALAWMAEAEMRVPGGTCLRTEIIKDETHLSSLPRAFRLAMRWWQDGSPPCVPSVPSAQDDRTDQNPGQ